MAAPVHTAYCKTLLGKPVPVHYDATTTIGDLKVQLHRALEVPSPAHVRLVIRGAVPEDCAVYASFRPELLGVGGHIVLLTDADATENPALGP